jgi:hypothetical protein
MTHADGQRNEFGTPKGGAAPEDDSDQVAVVTSSDVLMILYGDDGPCIEPSA